MKGLKSLIRLQNWKVDEQRRLIGEIESERAGLVQQGLDLEIEMVREQQISVQENNGASYGLFAAKLIERRENIEQAIDKIDERLNALHDTLAELVQELKRYELALEAREKEIKKEQEKVETVALDEMGMNMFQRNLKIN